MMPAVWLVFAPVCVDHRCSGTRPEPSCTRLVRRSVRVVSRHLHGLLFSLLIALAPALFGVGAYAHDGPGGHDDGAASGNPTVFPKPPRRPAHLPRLRPPTERTAAQAGPPPDASAFVRIPAGEAVLGGAGYGRHNPIRKAAFRPLFVQRFEVSVDEYAACVDAGDCVSPADEPLCNRPGHAPGTLPINCVSAADARAYAAYRRKLDGVHYRLPTCTEWERAARAGGAGRFPWGDAWPGARCNGCDANCPMSWRDPAVDDGYAGTAPVSALPQCGSGNGVEQMFGNVAEWCLGGLGGAHWDLRGGSFRHLRAFQDPAMPRRFDGLERGPETGFRLVVD